MSTALAVSPLRANLARAISDIFSPPVAAVPALALGVWASDVRGTCWYALAYFLIAVGIPTLYVVWAVRTGRISDFHVSNRSERVGPFVVSLICGLGAWLLCLALGAPLDFVAPVLALLLQTLALFVITLFWQISVHTAVTASLVTFACLVIGPAAASLFVLVPLVAWARIYLGRHTVSQTIVGACLGVSCFMLLIALHGIVW
jgi:membrane-associated phospholipid phosphatase